jgi:hypothetical protein
MTNRDIRDVSSELYIIWNDKSGGEIEADFLFTLQVDPVLFTFFVKK